MSTYLNRKTRSYVSDSRNWLLGPSGTGPGDNPSATFDVSAFDAAGLVNEHGFIPSGTAVSRQADGLWGPFDAAAVSGEHGLLFSFVVVPDPADLTQDVAGALVRNNANVDYNKLPAAGRPTLAALRTALPRVQIDDVTP